MLQKFSCPSWRTATILACVAILCGCSSQSKKDAGQATARLADTDNILSDPSFEDGPPRELHPTDATAWTGEEEGAAVILQGDAHSFSQFARMQMADPDEGNQSFLYNRFTAQPYTDYTLTFWTRGTAGRSISGSARARFLGDCHTIPRGCPDEDGDEDLDLGPEPPNYDKLILNETSVDGTADWQQTTLTFNSGPYTALAVVFYGEAFTGSDHMDVDDVSVSGGGGGCTPKSCADVGANCGSIDDGCGNTLDCGSCVDPETCGGGGVANVCGVACTPRSCADAGANCGSIDDGCGNTLDCGSCVSPETCGGGGVQNVCGVSSDPCTAKYGGQNGFQLCFETDTECGFEAVKDSVQSCDDVCAAAGGQCLGVHGNDSSDPCTDLGDKPGACGDTSKYDDICICSL